MAKVTLKNIYKVYDNKVTAVDDFNLDIKDKEFVVMVGPSGCGKSTTLRMIAGLEEISKGELYIGDRLVNNVDPKDRNIAMVFQNYALYPHMTVYENMAFGLKIRKFDKAEIDNRVREAAEILGIGEYLKRKPKELSGGQRQRVAIGRAIVREPEVFLMDEPLSNLDAKLRNQMRAEILKLHKKLNTTFVYVTHDQVEAMTLGDRIVVMRDGFIQQIATPQNIFENPVNIFVAGFIGSPQMNFLDAKLIKDGDNYYVNVLGKDVELSKEKLDVLKKNNVQAKDVILGIRPEHIGLTKDEEKAIKLKVEVTELIGSETFLHIRTEEKTMVVRIGAEFNIKSDDIVNLSFAPNKIHLFDKETEKSLFE